MAISLSRRAKALVALASSLLVLGLGMMSASTSAHAATSTYCGGWLGGYSACQGNARWLYQTYGWGDQYSVCVAIEVGFPWACSSGAGSGVYSAKLSSARWSKPAIYNGNNPSNFVHGVALQP